MNKRYQVKDLNRKVLAAASSKEKAIELAATIQDAAYIWDRGLLVSLKITGEPCNG